MCVFAYLEALIYYKMAESSEYGLSSFLFFSRLNIRFLSLTAFGTARRFVVDTLIVETFERYSKIVYFFGSVA